MVSRLLIAGLAMTAALGAVTMQNPYDHIIKEDHPPSWPTCAHYGGVDTIDWDGACCAKECGKHCATETCMEGGRECRHEKPHVSSPPSHPLALRAPSPPPPPSPSPARRQP